MLLCFWVVVAVLMPLLIASLGKATRYPLPRLGHGHRLAVRAQRVGAQHHRQTISRL